MIGASPLRLVIGAPERYQSGPGDEDNTCLSGHLLLSAAVGIGTVTPGPIDDGLTTAAPAGRWFGVAPSKRLLNELASGHERDSEDQSDVTWYSFARLKVTNESSYEKFAAVDVERLPM